MALFGEDLVQKSRYEKKTKKKQPEGCLDLGSARIELATSTMSTWHSPAELTAPDFCSQKLKKLL